MATKLGTLTLDLVARIGSFTQGMRNASASAEREMGRAGNSVNTVDGLLKKLVVTAGAVFSISQVSSYADSYISLQNRLKLVTGSQQELSQAINDTYAVSQKTAQSWDSTVQVYQRFAQNAKALGINLTEAARLTETVSKAVSISGSTAESAEAALVQFGQALSSGVLRGDEFRSISEQAGGLRDAIAKGLKLSVGELRDWAYAGKLTTSVVIKALQDAGVSVDELFNKTDFMGAQGWVLIKDAAVKMVGEFSKATGATKALFESLKAISENMTGITTAMGVGAAFMAGTYIPILTTTAIAYVRNTAEVIRYQFALAGMQASATNASRSLLLLRSALFGPVGVGVALASVAAGYLLMKGDAEKATSSIEYQGKKLEDLVVKYRELNTLQRDNETKALSDRLDELSLKFKVAASDLSAFIGALPASDEKIAFFEKLTREFQNGRISSDAYYESVKNANFLSDKQLDKVRGLIAGHKESKQALDGAKKAQEALSLSTGKTTDEIKNQAVGVAQLSEELKKLLSSNAESTYKNNYLNQMVGKKVDPKLAEILYEARKKEGLLGTGKTLSEETLKSVNDLWKSEQGLNKTLEDQTKAQEKSKKLIEAQGAAMKVNARVAANAAKYNFASIESKNKLPAGLLSAIHMQESKGDPSAYNKSSGATGGFQFLKATADQYGVKNRNDLAQSAEGAGKYMAYLLKLFKGDLDKAVSAYHAGEGNVQRGTNIGPVNRQYVKNIKGYMGGASGVSFTEDYSYDDYIKEQEQLVIERENQAQKQKEIQVRGATETVRIRSELADQLKEIEGAGFDAAETARLKAEYTTRAENEIKIAESAHADKLAEYSAYVKTEEQLINESYDRRQRDLKLDLDLTHDEYTQASLNLETMRKRELEAIRRDQALELLEAKRHWISAEDYARDYYALIREEILATSSYSPEMKQALVKEANFNQGMDQNADREQVWGDYQAEFGEQENPELARLKILKDALNEGLIAEEEYFTKRALLHTRWGIGYVSGAKDVLGQVLGENSKAYRAMFAMQKALAMAEVLMNAPATFSAVLKSASSIPMVGPFIAPGLAAGAVALQMAQVAAIGSVTFDPVGMAHDGIDNIPREGTWLLDKGERVVDKRTNGDLKDFIAKGGNGGGVTINVNVPPGYTGRQRTDADGNVTIDVVKQMLDERVNSIGSPNSHASRTIQNAFGLSPAR